ncbi:MAG: hypothetical protein HY287_10615 [Planctomycetes bacterium]|nr:hypothetical protein [Planctomycetota bacterium]
MEHSLDGNRRRANAFYRLFRPSRLGLCGVVIFYSAISIIGITWGLPSRSIDRFLFPDGDVWSGEKIYKLSNAGEKLSVEALRIRGADVDVNPTEAGTKNVISLNSTEQDIAQILLRYRLYTYQPDEMITMMALSGMNPRKLQLDPRLYQYGGLFVYPVGALIAAAGQLGLIDVRSKVAFYLDHPDEFGKFYVLARGYVAAWGIVGVLAVFAVAKRLSFAMTIPVDPVPESNIPKESDATDVHSEKWAINAGLFAAVLFAMMPVVICMSHEAKPHLPGAVLMLLAVLCGMRSISESRQRDRAIAKLASGRQFILMCICCGAALGMVLSSLPIFVLIPFVAVLIREKNSPFSQTIWRLFVGVAIAIGVHLLANPYIVINAFVNHDVLRSNFGNSLAMYRIDRLGEGFLRVGQLLIEGARFPVILMGTIGLALAVWRNGRKHPEIFVLALPLVLLFLQFVMIGAGKPAEYGRFSIFIDASLAIFAGCITAVRWRRARFPILRVVRIILIARVGMVGAAYIWGFRLDATGHGSRIEMADELQRMTTIAGTPLHISLTAEPAPYCCPPMNFAHASIVLAKGLGHREVARSDTKMLLLRPIDESVESIEDPDHRRSWLKRWVWRPTPISWADKPFRIENGPTANEEEPKPNN